MHRWIDGRTDKRRRRDVSLLLPPPPFFTLRRNWCPAERSQDRLLLLLLSAFNHSSEREKNKTKPWRRSSTRGNLGGVTDFKLVHFGYCGRKRYWAWESRREAAAVSLKRSKSTPDHFTSVSVTACNHTQPVAEKCAHVDKSVNIK